MRLPDFGRSSLITPDRLCARTMRGLGLQQRYHAVMECGHVAAVSGRCRLTSVRHARRRVQDRRALLASEDAGDQIAAAAHADFVED